MEEQEIALETLEEEAVVQRVQVEQERLVVQEAVLQTMAAVVVEEDTLLRLRRVQIEVDGHEETAIACIWVTDGIDHCRVGFLKRHMLKHAGHFNGVLMQVF